ncbi:hypothetical protein [Streptomyces sp. NBC_00038]|nr:hypothetical protein [Streptomyces sp. NBC_00038]MCX5558074.1 hypothetical protein [Streptomyces sp. NBC_00038]
MSDAHEPTGSREPEPPRYEPAPGVGKLALWVLLFVVAAVVVVVGGVYFA